MLSAIKSLLVIAALGLATATLAPTAPAYAGSCGGNGQKSCPIYKKGPECKAWLRKVGKICRPCGASGQLNCKVVSKGPACRKGLLIKKGRCVLANQTAIGTIGRGFMSAGKTVVQAPGDLLNSNRNKVREAARTFGPQIQSIAMDVGRALPRGHNATALANAIRSKDANKVRALLRQNNEMQNVFADLDKMGFRAVTLAVESSGAYGLGAGHETGFAMDLKLKRTPKFYTTSTLTGGYLFNLGNDVVISFFRSENDKLEGHAFGTVMDFDVGTGIGGNMWFTAKPFDFAGFAVGVGIGGLGGGGALTYGYTKYR